MDNADQALLACYPHPQPKSFRLSSQTANETGPPGRDSYRDRMHDLLYVEEMAQVEELRRFNVVARLKLTNSYLLFPTSASSSTAKYARPGELFGKMALGQDLSEDTSAGRLILTNCSMLMLSKPNKEHGKREKRKASKVIYYILVASC